MSPTSSTQVSSTRGLLLCPDRTLTLYSTSASASWAEGFPSTSAGPNHPAEQLVNGYQHQPHPPFLAEHHLEASSSKLIAPRTEQSGGAAEGHLAPPDHSEDDPSDIEIGMALMSGKFKCNLGQCGDKTFGRMHELRRHYKTKHSTRKPEFWCKEPLCRRSAASNGRPFPRDDKLRDHELQKHGRGGRVRRAAQE